jgi:hypothetical protein
LIGEKQGGAYELNLKLLGRLSVLKQELIVPKIVSSPSPPPFPSPPQKSPATRNNFRAEEKNKN